MNSSPPIRATKSCSLVSQSHEQKPMPWNHSTYIYVITFLYMCIHCIIYPFFITYISVCLKRFFLQFHISYFIILKR